MTLTITPELVTELAEHDSDPYTTGIVLGPDGWAIRSGLTESDGLVALWGSYVFEWLDGQDITPSDADLLAGSAPDGRSLQITDEDRDTTMPADNTDWVVVTGITREGDIVTDWAEAFWFDQNTARRVLVDHEELWVTAGGRWVQYLPAFGTSRAGWVEVGDSPSSDAVAAARLCYEANDDRFAADLPPLAVAARTLRTMVETLTPWASDGPEQPAEMVHALRGISELIRAGVLADLREQRGIAAQDVVDYFGGGRGAQTQAARYLGVGLSTLNGLLN